MTEPNSSLRPSAALREEVSRDLERLARQRRLRAGVLLLLLAALGVGVVAMRSPSAPPLSWTRWVPAAAFSLGGLLMLALALGLTLPDRARLTVACLATACGAFLLLGWGADFGASSGGARFVPLGLGCLLHGCAVATGVALAALLVGYGLLRRFAPTGAMVGTGAGLLSLAALQLGCPVSGVSHMMVWHGLVLVGFGVLTSVGWSVVERLRES